MIFAVNDRSRDVSVAVGRALSLAVRGAALAEIAAHMYQERAGRGAPGSCSLRFLQRSVRNAARSSSENSCDRLQCDRVGRAAHDRVRHRGADVVGGGRFLAQGCYSWVAGSTISMSPVLTS